MLIGVIGASECDAKTGSVAEQLGELIALKGHHLVCGGLGGVMRYACKGAKKKGGLTVGILPGASTFTKNEYVDIPIVTAMSHARNAIIVRTADILVAVGGKYGTLSEIALAKAINKTVIAIHSWDIPDVIAVNTPREAMGMIEQLMTKRRRTVYE
ncbi:MAG: TIGR00725 family protein, partial [Elusimicrobia bacterium]|nr:TIGR00725 family protein [Elusimicrobiota bacterium]MBD3412153.1 TIGR00725 family protein [Elusimicrobiota bacterium]